MTRRTRAERTLASALRGACRRAASTLAYQRRSWQVGACISVLGLGGCATSSSVPPRAASPPSAFEQCPREAASPQPTPALAASAAEARHGILSFDCGREDDPKLEGQKLRDFSGGGPQGSAWNFYGGDLRCVVRMRADCAAELQTTLRVGERGRFRARSQIAPNAEHTVELLVPSATWEAESGSDHGSSASAYSSLLFVARVDGVCAATADEPQERPFHWSDSFVGGFSGGE